MNKYFLIVVISMLATLQSHAERVDSVQQNHNIAKSASATAASAFLGSGTQSFTINLPQIQVDLTPTIPGVHKTGVVYQLPSQVTALQLPWESVIGGYVARIHLVSDQAKRLRYHLVLNQEIPSIEFRIQGNMDASPLGPIDHTFIHDGTIWLPITNGSNADLEIFVNDTMQPEALDFSIDAINLIVDDINSGNIPTIYEQSLGLVAEIEFDLACWSGNKDIYPGLEQAASATAKINFIVPGGSAMCTGTLLNDMGGTGTPWFATANHCISDQPTANTATFEWFFQATSCGGSATDSRYYQTSGGAQLLWTEVYLEASLIRLNKPPPYGAVFSGWDTDIQVGDLVWGVHHPKGDHTMVSEGNVAALLEPITSPTGAHLLNVVNYVYGGTEGGSSGSGLFSVSNGSAYWKGTLMGGPETNYQQSSYSDFNSYYTNIKTWLARLHSINKQVISALYVATFNRAPDKAGFTYWEDQFTTNSATAVRQLAAGFASHPAFTQLYGSLTNLAFVKGIYVNVLGGPGDDAGISYWNNLLNNGVSRSDFLAAFVQSALTVEINSTNFPNLTQAELEAAVIRQDYLTNKSDVGLFFADILGSKSNLSPGTNPNSLASLQADSVYQASQAILGDVTNDDNSVSTAYTLINAANATSDPVTFINNNT